MLTFLFQFVSRHGGILYIFSYILFYFHFHKTRLLSFNNVNVCSEFAGHFTTFNILHFSLCVRPWIGDGAPSHGVFAAVIKITSKTTLHPGCGHDGKFSGYMVWLKTSCLDAWCWRIFLQIHKRRLGTLLRNLMSDELLCVFFLFCCFFFFFPHFLYLFRLSTHLFLALVFWTDHHWILHSESVWAPRACCWLLKHRYVALVHPAKSWGTAFWRVTPSPALFFSAVVLRS